MPGPPNKMYIAQLIPTEENDCAALDKYASGDASEQGSLLLVSGKSQKERIDQFSAIKKIAKQAWLPFWGHPYFSRKGNVIVS